MTYVLLYFLIGLVCGAGYMVFKNKEVTATHSDEIGFAIMIAFMWPLALSIFGVGVLIIGLALVTQIIFETIGNDR